VRHPVRPSYFGPMEAMGAIGVDLADVPGFVGTERVSTVIAQATPNEYQA